MLIPTGWKSQIFAFVCMLGAACILVLFDSEFGTESQLSGGSRTREIIRTQRGFEPSILTIPIGVTVTFSSRLESPFWPASNLHPNHLIYPEFDPRTPIDSGETWTFTFDRPGEWRFHDHLASEATGVVHVTDSHEDRCDEGSAYCWDKLLYGSLQKYGIVAALNTLQRIHITNEQFARYCHEYAHDLGLQTYHLYGEDIGLTPKMSYCNAGFFHGYMEGLVGKAFDIETANQFCQSVKSTLVPSYPEAERQCRHGIGHGAMEYLITSNAQDWEEPEQMARPALEACAEANEDDNDVRRCAAGVFGALRDWMVSADDFKIYLDPRNLFSMCARLEHETSKSACYWEFAKYTVRYVRGNPPLPEIDIRAIIPSTDWAEYGPYIVRSWATGIGRRGVHSIEPESLIRFCRALPEETHIQCIRGLASGIIYAGISVGPPRAIELCKISQLNEDERHNCYVAIQEELTHLPATDAFPKYCERIPSASHTDAYCLNRRSSPSWSLEIARHLIPFFRSTPEMGVLE